MNVSAPVDLRPSPSSGEWGFAGWGSSQTAYLTKRRGGKLVSTAELAFQLRNDATTLDSEVTSGLEPENKYNAGLGVLASTSIAGNDLLSSCLYTGGICAGYAGKLAPVALVLVAAMLYIFRSIYSEVVTAMPINGGSYTSLSNTSSKSMAALAACMSLISYLATAVVSAESAVEYLQLVLPDSMGGEAITKVGTVCVLLAFAGINLLGVAESANVAVAMFVVHVVCLCALIMLGVVWASKNDWALFTSNLDEPYPDGASASEALFYGYSAALLGITGFETAANYVEEMAGGQVYVATLRNLWAAVAFFNPVLGFLAMACLPLGDGTTSDKGSLTNPDNSAIPLGLMAKVVGGGSFQTLISIDGALVLCGSVLTSYVGVTGLVKRMAMDRCLPSALLSTNRRGTPHWIIVSFFIAASSLFLALNGDVLMLSSVYNIAFLSVMGLFSASCIILKWKRPDLPRLVVSPPAYPIIGLILVVLGLIGNIARTPIVLAWFSLYLGVALAVVFSMFNRTVLLRVVLVMVKKALASPEEVLAFRRRNEAIIMSHRLKEENGRCRHDAPTKSPPTSPTLKRHRLPSFATPSVFFEDAGDSSEGMTTTGLLEATMKQPAEVANAQSLARRPTNRDIMAESVGAAVHFKMSSQVEAYAVLFDETICPGDVPMKRGGGWRARVLRYIEDRLTEINSQPHIFFAKSGDLETLNKAVLYVRNNEQTQHLIVAHVVDDSSDLLAVQAEWARTSRQQHPHSSVRPTFEEVLRAGLLPLSVSARQLVANVALLDTVYPKVKLDCVVVRGSAFGPEVVAWVSRRFKVDFNLMFMAQPDAYFPHKFASLGGLRIIMRGGDREVQAAHEAHAREVLLRGARLVQGIEVES